MIELRHTVPNPDKIVTWLESTIRPALRPDVSNYAKGRLRAWLGVEPMLFAPFDTKPAVPTDPKILDRLAELIEWDFDYCLVTYSGDTDPVGISPHMDAGYADFEARSIHLSGECLFEYWASRTTLGRSPTTKAFTLNRQTESVELEGNLTCATTAVNLQPGQVVAFNCKCPHAATPGVRRWNVNFWRKKPTVDRRTS